MKSSEIMANYLRNTHTPPSFMNFEDYLPTAVILLDKSFFYEESKPATTL